MVLAVLLIFVVGYLAIVLEHTLGINKTATALLMAALAWGALGLGSEVIETTVDALGHHLQSSAEVLFFLMGAMAIVEIMDAHQAFGLITDMLTTRRTVTLLWVVGIASFFLSAILDNLTTSIVMGTVMGKLVSDTPTRWRLAGVVIIAANAGGAASPIGDVTTTMLWIGGQVTALALLKHVLLPSFVCLVVPLAWLSVGLPKKLGAIETDTSEPGADRELPVRESRIMLFAGLAALLFIPVWKTVTGLPPYMGMLMGLGALWLVGQIVNRKKHGDERVRFSAAAALSRTDTPSILFFLGILLAVGALEEAQWLGKMADWLVATLPSEVTLAYALGLASAVIDNVPLVAAAQGMFSLADYPTDHIFWHQITFAAGTGGSVLVIGSAAGIAIMGIEQLTFGWYLRSIAGPALAGFTAGMAVFLF